MCACVKADVVRVRARAQSSANGQPRAFTAHRGGLALLVDPHAAGTTGANAAATSGGGGGLFSLFKARDAAMRDALVTLLPAPRCVSVLLCARRRDGDDDQHRSLGAWAFDKVKFTIILDVRLHAQTCCRHVIAFAPTDRRRSHGCRRVESVSRVDGDLGAILRATGRCHGWQVDCVLQTGEGG
jgi:hypothetical protein